jgi:FixJ family two-component response regulator
MNSHQAVIALVENDLPTNRAFARLLRAHGFAVEAYLSAELLLARDAEPAIDCLLLDVDLDGMSGLELQQQLRALQVPTPIIFITGRDDPAVRARAFELGCARFLCKPVESHVLVDAIRAAMDAAAGSALQ